MHLDFEVVLRTPIESTGLTGHLDEIVINSNWDALESASGRMLDTSSV